MNLGLAEDFLSFKCTIVKEQKEDDAYMNMLIHLQARLGNSGGDVVVGFAITDPAPNSIITLKLQILLKCQIFNRK